MASENFYFQLCHYLLTKFSNNTIEIPRHEWEAIANKYINIKHRINEKDNLEVVSTIEEN